MIFLGESFNENRGNLLILASSFLTIHSSISHTILFLREMAKSVRSKIKRKFRAIKRQEVYVPVVNKRQDECNKRLLVNTFLNKPSGLIFGLF